jgi:hypothetical protein
MRAFKRAVRTLSRWAIGIALLPLLWVLVRKLTGMMSAVAAEGYKTWWLYLAGATSYLAAERILSKPMWLYIVGHELTHALSGLLSGARIYSMRAGTKGGEVQLSKSNAFIALSPYIVPFYAALVVIAYAAARRWWAGGNVLPAFQALLGASLAFHFSLTFSALHGQQSDLKVVGFFLSGVVIAIGNILILSLLAVSLFAKTPTLKMFLKETGRETTMIWLKGLGYATNKTVKRFNPPAANQTPKDRTRWTR